MHHLKGSTRASVLLTGGLAFLLYVSATYAFGVAYNPLYLAYSLELAVLTPTAALAGLLVRRRAPLGYLLAAPLLVTIVLLPTIALRTVLQARAGIVVTTAEAVGLVAGFGVLGGIGVWLLVRLLRAVPAPSRSAPVAGSVGT